MAPAPAPELVEQLLVSLPAMRLLGLMRRSSNYTFLAALGPTVRDPDAEPAADEVMAIYKPAAGESPLWDFPAGTLYRREVAAYRLSRFLGWPRIPPTVARDDGPHGTGSVQLFVEADRSRHYLDSPGTPQTVWEEVAAFDIVANNADRKSGHCLTGADGAVWVIDHGLTFHAEPKLRTVIWEFAGMGLPTRLRPGLEAAADGLTTGGELRRALTGLLDRRELAVLRQRIQGLLEPGWRFPEPTSAWSVPWPPV